MSAAGMVCLAVSCVLGGVVVPHDLALLCPINNVAVPWAAVLGVEVGLDALVGGVEVQEGSDVGAAHEADAEGFDAVVDMLFFFFVA